MTDKTSPGGQTVIILLAIGGNPLLSNVYNRTAMNYEPSSICTFAHPHIRAVYFIAPKAAKHEFLCNISIVLNPTFASNASW